MAALTAVQIYFCQSFCCLPNFWFHMDWAAWHDSCFILVLLLCILSAAKIVTSKASNNYEYSTPWFSPQNFFSQSLPCFWRIVYPDFLAGLVIDAASPRIGVSRPPVLDCGTTFHPDCGGRDLPSTLSHNLWKLIYLATEELSESFEFIGAIELSLSIYLSTYLSIACGLLLSLSLCPSDGHDQEPCKKRMNRSSCGLGGSMKRVLRGGGSPTGRSTLGGGTYLGMRRLARGWYSQLYSLQGSSDAGCLWLSV